MRRRRRPRRGGDGCDPSDLSCLDGCGILCGAGSGGGGGTGGGGSPIGGGTPPSGAGAPSSPLTSWQASTDLPPGVAQVSPNLLGICDFGACIGDNYQGTIALPAPVVVPCVSNPICLTTVTVIAGGVLGYELYKHYFGKPSIPTISDLQQNCMPGRMIVEPSRSRP